MNNNKKKKIILSIIGITAIIIIILGLILLFKNNDNNVLDNKTNGSTEETIKKNYEFTKEDAINLIKPLFHSDNYSFEAELNDDSLYVVTITNTLTASKYIYYVDPATKTYRIDENTK